MRVRCYTPAHFTIAIIAGMPTIAIAHMVNTVERKIAQVMRGEMTGLLEFLAKEEPVGEMIRHYVAASITAKVRALAAPYSIHSLPVSGLQEDVVPQAGETSLRLLEVIELLQQLIDLEGKVVAVAENIERNRVTPRD